MEKIITYEAVFDEKTLGVYGISLVENPATQEFFIKLSEDEKAKIKEKPTEIALSTIDEEQRILLGLVLEPNIPIYRNQGGEEFNIVFSEDTVKNLAHSFIANGYQGNSTMEHDEMNQIKGVSFVENWTVSDPKKDKSNAYGLEYQKGSWLVAMKVESEEVWNDYIKTGKVKGFSIDAAVKLQEVKTNKKEEIKMTLSEKVVKAASDFAIKLGLVPEPIQLGSIPIDGGELVFEYEGEVLEAGVKVMVYSPSDPEDKIPVPVGQFPLEDGRVLIVTQEGVAGEIKPKEGEAEPAPEAPAEVPSVKEPVEAASEAESTAKQIQSILIKYEASFEKLEAIEAKMDTIQNDLNGVKKEVVEFSEQPSRKPVVQMASVDLNKQGRLLQQMRNAE